jgi:ketosteroid isomerase-like protein
MASSRENSARAILAAIATGAIPLAAFTPDARWWWNGGLDISVREFSALLATLHEQTVAGIHVTPGLILKQDDHLLVEATSHGPLKDGRIYANRYTFLFQFQGDRVALVKEYSDSAHVKDMFALG